MTCFGESRITVKRLGFALVEAALVGPSFTIDAVRCAS